MKADLLPTGGAEPALSEAEPVRVPLLGANLDQEDSPEALPPAPFTLPDWDRNSAFAVVFTNYRTVAKQKRRARRRGAVALAILLSLPGERALASWWLPWPPLLPPGCGDEW